MASSKDRMVEFRFWSQVNVGLDGECWEWKGNRFTNDYGQVSVNSKKKLTHKQAWVYMNGDIEDESLLVCHHCDNPPCCNPNHLFLGTHSDNMRDMIDKERDRWGNHVYTSTETYVQADKISDEKKIEIVRDSVDGLPIKSICLRHNITYYIFKRIMREFGGSC